MKKEVKNIAVLGSTGSVGRNTLKVISKQPDKFKVRALVAHSNAGLLSRQIKKVNPDIAVIADASKIDELKEKTKNTKTKLLAGLDAVIEITQDKKVDLVVVAISGMSALMPLMSAIKNKKDIALANKEALVVAGEIIINEAKKNKVRIIPVDSEHSAIFQCLHGKNINELKKIYITGSGGPLDKIPKSKLKEVTPEVALSHPKWQMGQKITVDSATLMNKGLEVIEAMHLFSVPLDKIKVLIHPEAIIHSMVEFVDGSILAQLGITDMRLPIQYALTFPERIPSPMPGVDFSKISKLTFKIPDVNKFPLLRIAYEAARRGGTCPCVLNAADEELVHAYLKKRIKLTDIPKIIEKVLSRHKSIQHPELTDILNVDKTTKELTKEIIERIER